MPLLLKWQTEEIALFDKGASDDVGAAILLSSVGLDFDLGPLTFKSDEDQHRLLAALTQLRDASGIEEEDVDLIIPASWGVTHLLPDPKLSDEDLSEHLRWELSKALIDSEDQYSYNFSVNADGSIAICALRIRLFDPIEQLIQEAGFRLRKLFFEGEPWIRIDLMGEATKQQLVSSPPPPVAEKVTEPKAEVSEPLLRSDRKGESHSKFFAVLAVIGVVLFVTFVWWKMTSRKPLETTSDQIAQEQMTTPAVVDTGVHGIDEGEITTETGEVSSKPPHPQTVSGAGNTSMADRLDLLDRAIALLEPGERYDMFSFTQDYFMGQFFSPEFDRLNSIISQVEDISPLGDATTSVVPPLNGRARGVVSGVCLKKAGSQSLVIPFKEDIISLGGENNLKNQGLIFTGDEADILSFLGALSARHYSIYRVVLMPWDEREYRTVIEL